MTWSRIKANIRPPKLSATDWIPDLGHPSGGEVANLNTDLVLPGTVSGGAVVSPGGIVDGGMRFNGRTGCRVETASTSSGIPPCTLSSWFSLSSSPGNGFVLCKGIRAYLGIYGGLFSGGTWTHFCQGAAGVLLADSRMHFGVVTITGTGYTSLYLNGSLAASLDTGIYAKVSSAALVGSRDASAYAWPGYIYAPAIHDGIILTPSQIAADQWNRLLAAKYLYIPPTRGHIDTGTYSTAGSWIGGTPIQVVSGTHVVENVSYGGHQTVGVRATVSGDLTMWPDGHLNGCLGPAAEAYGNQTYYHKNGGAADTQIDFQGGAADSVRLTLSAAGDATITRIGTGALAVFSGANTSGQYNLWRIEISKDLAAGYQVTLWRDGVKLVPTSGSNPTARVNTVLTRVSTVVTLGAGNTLGLGELSSGPGWEVTV